MESSCRARSSASAAACCCFCKCCGKCRIYRKKNSKYCVCTEVVKYEKLLLLVFVNVKTVIWINHQPMGIYCFLQDMMDND